MPLWSSWHQEWMFFKSSEFCCLKLLLSLSQQKTVPVRNLLSCSPSLCPLILVYSGYLIFLQGYGHQLSQLEGGEKNSFNTDAAKGGLCLPCHKMKVVYGDMAEKKMLPRNTCAMVK